MKDEKLENKNPISPKQNGEILRMKKEGFRKKGPAGTLSEFEQEMSVDNPPSEFGPESREEFLDMDLWANISIPEGPSHRQWVHAIP